MALAGGANLVLSPIPMLALAKLGALSRTGRCKAFDSSADGYVRGEGVAVVVLKRMCDAVADGDRIRAVIRGTCVNHGGQTNGLTAPNPQAQREVIMGALAAASISAERVGYVEAHGTGTPLGDQIELSVLEEVFGKRGDAPRLRVGSVKTNIGHLEAAAGVAGLIKAALCIDHREVARQLYSAHARVGSAAEELNVATVQEPWPDVERQPYAGVSSFGFSGTNAHLIVGPAPGMRVATTTRTGVPILTLSAKNPAQLRVLMRLWCDRIRLVKDHHELADLCAASARQRDHMLERFACVVRDRASLQQALDAPPGAHTTLHDERPPVPSLALLIGDGDEWVAAAKACAGSPGFQRELTAVVEALQPIAGPSVRLDCEAILAAGTHRAASKPAAFALRVAVIRTVQRWDLKTVRVLAAGECEAAAAYVAGLSTAEECLALPAERPVSQPVRFDCSADEEVTDVLSIGGVAIAGQHQRIWQMPVSAEAANVLLMELLKSAYLRSSNVDWTSVMAPPQQSVALPLYPFARVSHWLTSGRTQRPSEQGRMQLPNGG